MKSIKKRKNGRKKSVKKVKSRNKRESKKYPALDPLVNLKTRVELIDYDYIDKLSDKEKAWLNQFTEEYTIASFKKGKKPLNKDPRDSYNRNNARNRCIYTKTKAQGKLHYLEDLNLNREEQSDEMDYVSYLEEQLELANNSKDTGDDTDNNSNSTD